jgi:Uncharacterized protein conserved in bacteria (DUF2252)
VLARAHARAGDPTAIAGYIGNGRRFTKPSQHFAFGYADQTTNDT